jgi:hypothetical protein
MAEGPGIKLARTILIPPRSTLRVEATGGSSLLVYVRGLRGMDVE